MTATLYIITLALVAVVIAVPIIWWCYLMLGNVRKRIESKIDEAVNIQNSILNKKIEKMQTDINEMRRELVDIKTVSVLKNRKSFPVCMKGNGRP